ncbi:NifU family protein [Streptomyces sp. NPDC048297]|uniref:NifU family protein n=1 Tax=Streptomyces sp. NPDC048297 TaxID=3365531 RepID=UPI00371B9CC7
MPEAVRLPDAAVEARLTRLDELLTGLESAPGPLAREAQETVGLLTEVYGEALARVLDGADEALGARLADDELVGHLLVLHAIHPEPVERRAARAVEKLRPAVRERGGDLEWAGVEGRVARVRLSSGSACGSGCGGSSAGTIEAVRAAVLAVAPELDSVEEIAPERRAAAPAFVPLTTLTRRTAARAREAG